MKYSIYTRLCSKLCELEMSRKSLSVSRLGDDEFQLGREIKAVADEAWLWVVVWLECEIGRRSIGSE